MSDSKAYCAHSLCGRGATERDLAEVPCALDDCPFATVSAKPPEKELSPLARAVREARGGDHLRATEFKGYA